jgi:hypothetical protein
MATLANLLITRDQAVNRSTERKKNGRIFYFTHTNVTGTVNYNTCCYCWCSPGTGIAIIEAWGASGTGGLMCCCSGSGIPGNAGAYSRICVCVCAASAVVGWVGCSPTGGSLCYPGRSQCTVACISGTSCNNTLTAQGGFGGYTNCSTGTAHYCCLAAAGFSNTLTNTFCGILCNVGGPNGAAAATASGGDFNIPGPISCLRTWDCCQYHQCNMEIMLGVSAGIYSSCCPVCLNFFRSEFPGYGIISAGWSQQDVSMAAFTGTMPHRGQCWNSNQPCGCYEHDGCVLNSVGFPGQSGASCPGVRSSGYKGGHGGVRITFYS